MPPQYRPIAKLWLKREDSVVPAAPIAFIARVERGHSQRSYLALDDSPFSHQGGMPVSDTQSADDQLKLVGWILPGRAVKHTNLVSLAHLNGYHGRILPTHFANDLFDSITSYVRDRPNAP